MTLPIGKTEPNNAFTLIEILLVIIIAAVVLAMALPNFSQGYRQFQLKKMSDDLISVARWAQAMAMGQHRIYALFFSNDRRSYVMMRAPQDDDGQKGDFQQISGSLGRRRIIPADIHLNVQQDGIRFYPDGTIEGVTIKLTSFQQKTVLSSAVVRGVLTVVDNE